MQIDVRRGMPRIKSGVRETEPKPPKPANEKLRASSGIFGHFGNFGHPRTFSDIRSSPPPASAMDGVRFSKSRARQKTRAFYISVRAAHFVHARGCYFF
jgi:hypothetical protein